VSNTSITNVEITDTFQIWISKTNEVIDILNENVMLAGPGAGYTVLGNTTLVGDFTATNISATESASLNSIETSGISRVEDITLPINFFSPINVTGNQENLLTLRTTVGTRPVLRLTNGANSTWAIGQSTAVTGAPITIRIEGSASSQLTLTQEGNLTVSGTITTGSGGAFTGNLIGNVTGNLTGNVTGNVTGNLTGNVTGTVSSLSNHTTNALAEGTNNLYFTTARARASISVSGDLTYNSQTGVITSVTPNVRDSFSAGVGVAYNARTGVISIGQAVAISDSVTFATITGNGPITSTGDITAFFGASDIRKKENIVRIDNALNKVMQIGGYTYNFKGDDRKITGVIAQEIEQVLPEVVYDVDDVEYGKSKAVRYGNIVGLLIEAIKDLKAELDELKGR